jgi:hypothetical protein
MRAIAASRVLHKCGDAVTALQGLVEEVHPGSTGRTENQHIHPICHQCSLLKVDFRHLDLGVRCWGNKP